MDNNFKNINRSVRNECKRVNDMAQMFRSLIKIFEASLYSSKEPITGFK